MDPITLTFLVVGAIGIALLALALIVGDVLHLALHADADGPFSLPAIAAFFGSAGFFGAIPASLMAGHLSGGVIVAASTAVGVVCALPVAFGAVRLTAGLMRMRTDPTLTERDLEGTLGVVISSIPATGFGEVRLRIHGQDLKYSARAAHALVAGTPVFVTTALSPTSVEVVSTAPEV
ncbi:MAG: hypothetical protein WKF57_05425 [Nakamurella sp.]